MKLLFFFTISCHSKTKRGLLVLVSDNPHIPSVTPENFQQCSGHILCVQPGRKQSRCISLYDFFSSLTQNNLTMSNWANERCLVFFFFLTEDETRKSQFHFQNSSFMCLQHFSKLIGLVCKSQWGQIEDTSFHKYYRMSLCKCQ